MRRTPLIQALVVLALLVAPLARPVGAAGLTPVAVPDVTPQVVFSGSGWGHGVGMSQYGAYGMARAGHGYGKILAHYYPGTGVTTVASPTVRVNLDGGATTIRVQLTSGSPGNVPWQVCTSSGCANEISQRPGETFAVTRYQATWTLTREGCRSDDSAACRWTGTGESVRLPFADSGGTVVAPNPNGGPKTYAYGRFDVSAGATDRANLLVNVLPMERYLRGLGEMPSSWGANGGRAALEAQVVAARTYALGKYREGIKGSCDCHLLATPRNQVFTGYSKELEPYASYWTSAVTGTAGRVATHDGRLISAVYSSSHARTSERVDDSWAFASSPVPYLRAVDDRWSNRVNNPYARWRCTAYNRTVTSYLGTDIRRIQSLTETAAETAGGTPTTLRLTGWRSDGTLASRTWSGPNKGIAGAGLRYDPSTRKGVPVIECRDKNARRVSLTTLPSQQLTRVGLAPFVDDDGISHETNIARVEAAGITRGCNRAGDRFCPRKKLNRAEMATFLMRSFKELGPMDGSYFRDVADGSTHEGAIYAIYRAGITQGCGGGRYYCPNRSVTRAEMAAFIQRALDLPDAREPYADVPDGAWYAPAVGALRKAGITQGCSPTRYCPDRAVTRAEMATFLVRALTS